MATSPEPSVDPGHLLRALRVFVAEAVEPAKAEGGEPGPDTSQGAEADGGDALGWEEAGCLLWDVAALPDDAAFLLKHGLPAMLPPLLTAAAARERWRALEIGLGTAANLACHDEARRQLLQLEGLPALLLDRLLWVDDAGSLTEACRCASTLLGAGLNREAVEAWWALLLREETLGRIVWIVENTLITALLERALNLLTCLVAAACAAKASGDGSKARLVPLLTCLGLLPLLASVLHGWVVRLQAERRHFGGADSAGGSPAAQQERAQAQAPASLGEEGRGQQQGQQRAGAGAGDPAPNDASGAAFKAVDAAAAAELEQDAEAGGAVAAEISEAAAMEALGLLEALAADVAGEAALNASALVKDALLRLVAEAELHGMQALAISLLAGLEGVTPLLLTQPAALAAVLASLEAAARARPEKRQRTEASGRGAAAAAAIGSAEAQAEEVEAAWALCSAVAKAAGTEQAQHDSKEALAVLVAHTAVLCHEWSASPRALAIQMHQAYVLRRLMPLFGEHAEEPKAALARCKAGAAEAK
ncbi:hypothetical protein ABPG75_004157 [Micractinium tetrahymenae]